MSIFSTYGKVEHLLTLRYGQTDPLIMESWMSESLDLIWDRIGYWHPYYRHEAEFTILDGQSTLPLEDDDGNVFTGIFSIGLGDCIFIPPCGKDCCAPEKSVSTTTPRGKNVLAGEGESAVPVVTAQTPTCWSAFGDEIKFDKPFVYPDPQPVGWVQPTVTVSGFRRPNCKFYEVVGDTIDWSLPIDTPKAYWSIFAKLVEAEMNEACDDLGKAFSVREVNLQRLDRLRVTEGHEYRASHPGNYTPVVYARKARTHSSCDMPTVNTDCCPTDEPISQPGCSCGS